MIKELRQFLDYLELEKNSSSHTLSAYRRDIEQYLSFIESRKRKYSQADNILIRSFLAFLYNNNIKKSSAARKLAAIRSFYQYCVHRRWVKENPAKVVSTPKQGKNVPSFLSEEEMQALISRLKLEHPISISYKNPSLKVELLSQYFHLRVAIDFPPLSPNGPTVNIRKIKANPFTLKDLINLGSFPPIIGAYLIETVNQRKNITIIGEPNAGKTTLANAIDLYTPKFWRKIVIEDAIESISQKGLGYKQTVIQVDSFDSNKSNYNKTSEILKLLHRSPDWIYLGEIQTKEHTKAMFEALNSGLKGIQTAHSDSFEKLIRRWLNYGVSAEDFLSLEVIIVMERKITNDGKISRVIKEIFEINNKNSNNSSSFYQKIYDKAWKLTQIRESLRTNSILSKRYKQILLKERELQ